MKPRIVVVGSSNTDMIIKVPHLPLPGETVLGKEFHMVHGGKGANQAVAAARAGGDVVFLACLGNDTFGKNALENLKSEGIDITHIKIIESKPSGIAVINVSEAGENSISVAPGANSELLSEDIVKLKAALLSADMILLQLEIPIETVERTIRFAHDNDIPVILNPAPARIIDPELLKLVNILTPNETEAAILTRSENKKFGSDRLIAELKKLGIQTVILTLGEKGVLFSSNGHEGHQNGIKVNVIDTTAAGDTFNGYLAVALARGDNMEKAVRIANNAASVSVTRLGASTSIPYMDEIKLQNN